MGTFGGWSQKPQLSLSNVGWAHDLFVPMDKHMTNQIKRRAQDEGKEMVRKTVSKNGAKQHVTLCFEYSTLLQLLFSKNWLLSCGHLEYRYIVRDESLVRS